MTGRSIAFADHDAFAPLYRTYSALVYRVCLRLLRDPADAEDAAQDVFIRVFLKAHTFRGDSAFSSWLYRLATNVALMRLRSSRRKRSLRHEDLDGPERPFLEIGVQDTYLSGVLNRIDLQSALDSLPDGYRQAFLLHDIQGYDHNEIARICGYSVGNSKSQVHRARKRLRQMLSKRRSGEIGTRPRRACPN